MEWEGQSPFLFTLGFSLNHQHPVLSFANLQNWNDLLGLETKVDGPFWLSLNLLIKLTITSSSENAS